MELSADLHIFGDKRIGTDDAVFADLDVMSTIAPIPIKLLSPTVQPWSIAKMPNRHAFANGDDSNTFIGVYHTVFLHITILPK